MRKKLTVISGILVGLLVLGVGGAYASDSATPGDILYPLDLMYESMERVIKIDPVSRVDFETDVLEERVIELGELTVDGELDNIEVVVDSISDQQNELNERVIVMNEECTGDNCDEGEKERVVNRIVEQNQEHTQTMEESHIVIEEKYGEDQCAGACGKLEHVIETFENEVDLNVDTDVEENIVIEEGVEEEQE